MYLTSYFIIRKDAFGYSLVSVQDGQEAFSLFSRDLEYCLNLLFNQKVTSSIVLQNLLIINVICLTNSHA